jgi:BirA family biotin operon repressor/biotin-[acetyl-CoA-carboxylase] ligase
MADFPRSTGGVPVVALETVGSTNEEALARASGGERGPLWLVARRQSAGRGRRGRAWISEEGNLHASLLLAAPAPASAVSGICFVAALALHDAILELAQDLAPSRLQLKWPNDLLLDGRKLAGILVEGSTAEAGATRVVVGFGVNCGQHPGGCEIPATSLSAAGYPIAPETLLGSLGAAMQTRLTEWARGENFAASRAAWLARASGLGAAIEVRLADKTIAGTFDALDSRGALVLRRGDGSRETIVAGDVFPMTAA